MKNDRNPDASKIEKGGDRKPFSATRSIKTKIQRKCTRRVL
jgi:hypothetical protein